MTAFLENFDYIALILCAGAAFFASLRFVHMLQLESYQGPMYLKWLKKNLLRDWAPPALIALICLLLEGALLFASRSLGARLPVTTFLIGQCVLRLIYVALMLFLAFAWLKQPAKKPLAYTGRVKRLCAAIGVLVLLVCSVRFLMRSYGIISVGQYLLLRGMFYLPALFLPLVVYVAHCCMLPVEEANKRRYFNDAKRRLAARKDLIRIGITGSYGKTSTKFILGTILSEKYNTLIPPHSYNTPMGLTRVIREQMTPENQVFVAEMGARYVGDIEELCELVHPSIGLITSVGPQHLETFGSQENINNTKYELIASLPPDGAAFFNGDNDICRTLYARCPLKKKYLFGVNGDDLTLRAVDISAGPGGSSFTLLTEKGETVSCTTPLLGLHNIINITGCAAVALEMGMSLREIAAGIKKLQPVEHRLQLIPGGAVTVIDDAFNSNPAGAKAAMEVLRSFPGRKIVVTPGMIELGEKEAELNEEFGKEMAYSTDFAILVGQKRSEPIKRGMLSLEFPEENIFVVNSLDQATAVLSHLSAPGDVVLFENDLPDNYNE